MNLHSGIIFNGPPINSHSATILNGTPIKFHSGTILSGTPVSLQSVTQHTSIPATPQRTDGSYLCIVVRCLGKKKKDAGLAKPSLPSVDNPFKMNEMNVVAHCNNLHCIM